MIRFSKSILSNKESVYNNMFNSDFKNLIKTKEENLSELLNIKMNNLSHLDNVNIIYDSLIQLNNFKEFILINEIDKDTILNILKTGITKSYNINQEIFKKKTKPQFYFLVLSGSVSYNNSNNIYTPGSFFGDEIIKDIHYKNNAIALKDETILLLLPKESFNEYLKNNIIKTNDKIKNSLIKNFPIFNNFDNLTIEKYKARRITKIFPETGDTIVSNEDIADAIFIIYKGNCSLNIGENADLMILGEDNLFGIESLNNLDEKGNLMDNKYLYNIINKSPNSIILKFSIKNLHVSIINDLKAQLIPSLLERNDILKKHEKMREDLKNNLVKKYNSLEKEKFKKKLLLTSYRELSSEEVEKSYFKEYKNIRQNQRYINDKQKFIHRNSRLAMKNIIDKKYLFDKMKKSHSCSNYLQNNKNEISNNRKKIMSNLLLKKDTLDLKKIVLNSDLKKLIHIKKEIKNKEENKENKEQIPNSYRTFNDKDAEYDKNNIFFTAVNMNRNKRKKSLYRTINMINSKENSHTYRKKLNNKIKDCKGEEYSTIKDDGSNTIVGSTFFDSISFRKNRKYISAKKQIEAYGCTALDSMKYFNFGERKKSLYSNIYENYKNRDNYKNCLFYETNKYNIPLFVLCGKKEAIKLPDISHY